VSEVGLAAKLAEHKKKMAEAVMEKDAAFNGRNRR
jgi:hypothetical protein